MVLLLQMQRNLSLSIKFKILFEVFKHKNNFSLGNNFLLFLDGVGFVAGLTLMEYG